MAASWCLGGRSQSCQHRMQARPGLLHSKAESSGYCLHCCRMKGIHDAMIAHVMCCSAMESARETQPSPASPKSWFDGSTALVLS